MAKTWELSAGMASAVTIYPLYQNARDYVDILGGGENACN
jgi:hypothetical protein